MIQHRPLKELQHTNSLQRSAALDPPFWTYHAEGWCHSKSAHWLYANHRCVFIDIKMDVVDSQ
jgi:hypothetical protein